MRPSKKHGRVEVVWDDSTVNNGRWCDIKDVLDPASRATTRIHSVGFVLADDETGVVLASGVHGNEATGITHIPRGCVRRVKRLQPIPATDEAAPAPNSTQAPNSPQTPATGEARCEACGKAEGYFWHWASAVVATHPFQPNPEPACHLCRRTKDEHAARTDLLHTFTPEPAPRAYTTVTADDWVMAEPTSDQDDQLEAVRSGVLTYEATHCKHGTFTGHWAGPDYLCGQCEMGDEPEGGDQ